MENINSSLISQFLSGATIVINQGKGRKYSLWAEVKGKKHTRHAIIYVTAKTKSQAMEIARNNGF